MSELASHVRPPSIAPSRDGPPPVHAPRTIPQSAPAPAGDQVGDRLVQADNFQRLSSLLVSLIVHFVAIIILGIWWLTPEDTQRPVALITTLDGDGADEGLDELEPAPLETPFETPQEILDPQASEPDPFVELVDFAALETASFDVELEPTMPTDLPGDIAPIYAGRSAATRRETALREGGSPGSEEAVALGLRWLAEHQNRDGSWSLHDFHRGAACRRQCTHVGLRSDTAGTALALLPFLGAGETPRHGQYATLVGHGIDWLIEEQRSDGDLRGAGGGNMYAHAMATIVLCEAYALTQEESYRDPAQGALDFIVAAQHSVGGWRYSPNSPGDTSVVGWQIMALRSGQLAYLNVPDETLKLASAYLDSAQTDSIGATYGYQPGTSTTWPMTAEALLCRQYLGWRQRHPGLRQGVHLLIENLPRSGDVNIYYWYYGTQTMHHFGGRPWNVWNEAMRDLLVSMQVKEGHAAGSWTPQGSFDAGRGGRIYMTSLALCTLEVYYRHMPLYRHHAVNK